MIPSKKNVKGKTKALTLKKALAKIHQINNPRKRETKSVTKRIKARHGEGPTADSIAEMLSKFYNVYQPVAEDESNSINVNVTSEMSKDDVLKEILRLAG